LLSAVLWQFGHSGAGPEWRTSFSNSLPHELHAYSYIGMTIAPTCFNGSEFTSPASTGRALLECGSYHAWGGTWLERKVCAWLDTSICPGGGQIVLNGNTAYVPYPPQKYKLKFITRSSTQLPLAVDMRR
jgi:hypothetical protein